MCLTLSFNIGVKCGKCHLNWKSKWNKSCWWNGVHKLCRSFCSFVAMWDANPYSIKMWTPQWWRLHLQYLQIAHTTPSQTSINVISYCYRTLWNCVKQKFMGTTARELSCFFWIDGWRWTQILIRFSLLMSWSFFFPTIDSKSILMWKIDKSTVFK